MMLRSAELRKLAERVKDHKMSSAERRDHRASLIMGLRGHSSTLTKEKVKTLMEEIEGTTA
jgi:hypothetical protein